MSCQMTFLPQSVNKIVCRSTVDLLSVYGNCPSQLPKILRQVIALVPAATTYTTGDSPGVPPHTPRYASNHLIGPNHIDLAASGMDPSAPCFTPAPLSKERMKTSTLN